MHCTPRLTRLKDWSLRERRGGTYSAVQFFASSSNLHQPLERATRHTLQLSSSMLSDSSKRRARMLRRKPRLDLVRQPRSRRRARTRAEQKYVRRSCRTACTSVGGTRARSIETRRNEERDEQTASEEGPSGSRRQQSVVSSSVHVDPSLPRARWNVNEANLRARERSPRLGPSPSALLARAELCTVRVAQRRADRALQRLPPRPELLSPRSHRRRPLN